MSKIQINKITNANVYLDGLSLLGRAEEVALPDVKAIMVEHKALGMVGSAEFFAGFEKMTAKIKWNSLYVEVMRKSGNPTKAVQLMVRSSLETYTGQGRTQESPVVTMLNGVFTNFPLGEHKQHENVSYETNMAISYVKSTVAGIDVFEIDVIENIYKVGGEDVLAQYRLNIGA